MEVRKCRNDLVCCDGQCSQCVNIETTTTSTPNDGSYGSYSYKTVTITQERGTEMFYPQVDGITPSVINGKNK